MVFQFHRDAGQQFEQQRRVTTNTIIPFIEEAFPIKEDLHMLEIGRVRVWGLNQEGLVFSPYTHGDGELEAGGYLGDFHISASLSNPYLVGGGSAGPLFKGISAAPRAEMFKYIGGLDINVLAGASYLREDLLVLKGLFGGFTRKKLILLGEVDFATDWAAPGSTALASYFEFDFQVTQGGTHVPQIRFLRRRYGLAGQFPFPTDPGGRMVSHALRRGQAPDPAEPQYHRSPPDRPHSAAAPHLHLVRCSGRPGDRRVLPDARGCQDHPAVPDLPVLLTGGKAIIQRSISDYKLRSLVEYPFGCSHCIQTGWYFFRVSAIVYQDQGQWFHVACCGTSAEIPCSAC